MEQLCNTKSSNDSKTVGLYPDNESGFYCKIQHLHKYESNHEANNQHKEEKQKTHYALNHTIALRIKKK